MWLFKKGSLRRAFIVNLISGIRFLGPLVALFAILKLISVWMNKLVDRLPDSVNPYTYVPNAPGIGLITLIILLVILGWLIRRSTDSWLLRIANNVIVSTPVVGVLYKAFKQLTEILLRERHEYFQVVLVPFQHQGIYRMGLVTGQTTDSIQPNNAQDYVNVFLPTTPNPTSGYYLQVPKKDLIPLDITVEEALQTIISAGVASPGYLNAGNKVPDYAGTANIKLDNQNMSFKDEHKSKEKNDDS